MRGKVKWFDENRGFGVIRLIDSGKEVTVHYKDILGNGFKVLNEGEEVECGVQETKRGAKAVDVRRIELDE